MTSRSRTRRFPSDLEDRLHVAAVVASQRVMDEHVRSAVELVEEGGDRAPVERLLATYARLHYLDARDTRQLHERALATLGNDAGDVGTLTGPRTAWGRLLRRLRGRRNPELRTWVEQHTARAELAVLDIHVQNALEAVRLVGEHGSAGEAVAFYAESLALRPTMAEMVNLRVLKSLFERDSAQVEPLRRDGPAPIELRVADHHR